MHFSFRTILFLAYTIPNIYVFLRIRHLFISRRYTSWYTVIYLLLACIYPITWNRPTDGWFFKMLSTISDYLLPLYLYIFLSLLTIDILLLFNLAFKVVPKKTLKSSRFRKYAFISMLAADVLIVVYGIINMNAIRTSEYQISVPKRSSHLNHLRIAFASDFHLHERTGPGFVKRFERKTEEINPDLMIYGGDIIESVRDNGNIKEYERILRKIHPRYGVYGVVGNHEFYAGRENGSFFSKAGMRLLCDTSVIIEGCFIITGRYDSHFTGRKQVMDLLGSVPDSLPIILVDHRPTEIDQVSSTRVDIQLSGHTHNGQLFPINLITRRVYQLSWGYMKKGNTHFFVSSGIRLWGPPVRTTGKSEIMVIDVTFE